MMGVTSEEGGLILLLALGTEREKMADYIQNGVGHNDAFFHQSLSQVVDMVGAPSYMAAELSEYTQNQYTHNFEDKMANLRGLLDFYADKLFVAPTVGTARRVAEDNSNNVYVYYLDQSPRLPRGKKLPIGFPMLHQAANPELKFGAMHGFDAFYMFGHGLVKGAPLSYEDIFSDTDKAISRSMVHAWATFAKTG